MSPPPAAPFGKSPRPTAGISFRAFVTGVIIPHAAFLPSSRMSAPREQEPWLPSRCPSIPICAWYTVGVNIGGMNECGFKRISSTQQPSPCPSLLVVIQGKPWASAEREQSPPGPPRLPPFYESRDVTPRTASWGHSQPAGKVTRLPAR